ncbi:hypothetical protein ACHAQH_000749 [Verticillium albo-atrum]
MSLAALPTDILLEIIAHFPIAAPIASLSRTSKALHALVAHQGWKIFLLNAFPSLNLVEPPAARWDILARALTTNSRLQDRHSYVPVVYTDSRSSTGNFFHGYSSNAHPFSPCVDARVVHAGTQELVVWGAGEDLVGRFRGVTSKAEGWFRMEGRTAGHKPVEGDVTALRIAEPNGRLGMFVGRASGGLELISADGRDAGRVVREFEVPRLRGTAQGASWGSVGFVNLFPGHERVVSGNRASLGIYSLTSEEDRVRPLESYTFPGPNDAPTRFIHTAKPLSGTTIACALGGDDAPLRFLTLTPTGLTPLSTGKPQRLLSKLPKGGQTTVRALETLSPNILLSAWDDGSVRLTDLRSPRGEDALFRDRAYQPDEPLSSLLTWGTERFVAGSNEHPHLKIFDVRRPERGYAYTDAAPCRVQGPVPAPQGGWDALLNARPRCDVLSGKRCGFHALGRSVGNRPSSVVILQPGPEARTRPARVHGLAKAGDASGSFYIGLPGAVAEVRLGEGGEGVSHAEARAAAVRGWKGEEAEYSFLEIGEGRVASHMDWDGLAWSESNLGLRPFAGAPKLVRRTAWDKSQSRRGKAWHRWDKRFWETEHFDFS